MAFSVNAYFNRITCVNTNWNKSGYVGRFILAFPLLITHVEPKTPDLAIAKLVFLSSK